MILGLLVIAIIFLSYPSINTGEKVSKLKVFKTFKDFFHFESEYSLLSGDFLVGESLFDAWLLFFFSPVFEAQRKR